MTDRVSGKLLLVGRVAGAHGIKGELRISSYTEDPLAILGFGRLLGEEGGHALTLTGGRLAKDAVIARAEESPDRNAAEALRGLKLFITRDALPEPEEDEFYLTDLIGMRAETPDGELLGEIKSVQNYRAGDILEIDPGQGQPTWLLPFTRDAVPEVSLADRRIVAVRPEETE
jgi:16S rRNA processing protein RimM